MQNYQRVRITAKLKTCSYLHIGSGEEDIFDNTQNKTASVIKTTAKTPQLYIPASTLRGFLFAKGNQQKNGISREQIEKLFGFSNENTRQMGCCRFSNAFDTNNLTLEKRHGIELNPKTRLVERHKLYSYEVVPAGAKFEFNLEMDACSDAEIKTLCQLIAYWDGAERSALGFKRGQGLGKIKIENLAIKTLSEKSILEWLEKDDDLDNYFEDYTLPVQQAPKKNVFTCKLHATAPIIVLDASKTTGNQLICHQTPDNKGLIPGTSLKGLLKGHCRKILLTILNQIFNVRIEIAEECVNKYLAPIFGTEEFAGFIQVSEAISSEPLSINKRPMIAIDRFSGGVKGGGEKNEKREEKAQGALLEILAANNELWDMTIHTHETVAAPEGNGWKGLLLLTLRDAMEGDLSIGFGKSRGFGSFRIEPEFKETYSNWDELMPELQKHYLLKDWIQALHNELIASAQKIKEAS